MHQIEVWKLTHEEKLELFEAYLRGWTAAAQGDPCEPDEDTPLERHRYIEGHTAKRVEVVFKSIA